MVLVLGGERGEALEEAQVCALGVGEEGGGRGEPHPAKTLLSPTALASEEPADPLWDGLGLVSEGPRTPTGSWTGSLPGPSKHHYVL